MLGGISHGHEFLKRNKKTSVEVKLLKFYLMKNAPQKARDLHKKLKGAIDAGRWLRLEADILEFEGRYQDAIDAIESMPDKASFIGFTGTMIEILASLRDDGSGGKMRTTVFRISKKICFGSCSLLFDRSA